MENSGTPTANTNPSMEGVTPVGGDNENQRPMDPPGPQSRTMLNEMEQSGALASGNAAYRMFPRDGEKSPDSTYC